MIATIIRPHGSRSAVKLAVAVRSGDVISMWPLNAVVPHYEEARAEAALRFPNYQIIIPRLGERA